MDWGQICGGWIQLLGIVIIIIIIVIVIIIILKCYFDANDQGAFFNCCVHVIMYSYYALSTLGDSVRYFLNPNQEWIGAFKSFPVNEDRKEN